MACKVLFACVLLFVTARVEAAVSNDDIRMAILQVVNVVRNIDDKLERHEYREKSVGEQVKKGIVNLDKRLRLLDPVRGTVSRIDERLAVIETILMQRDKEEKERQAQHQRIYEAILDLQKNLPSVIDKLNQDISQKILDSTPPAAISEPMMTKSDFTKMEKEVINKMESVTATINKMENELLKIRQDNMNDIKAVTNQSSENLEKVKRQLDSSELLLSKYESKLAELNNKIPEIDVRSYKEDDGWKEDLLKGLSNQKLQINDVLKEVRDVQSSINRLPGKSDIEMSNNQTLHKLEEVKLGLPSSHIEALEDLERTVKEVSTEAAKHQETVKASFSELTDIASRLTEGFTKNYGEIRADFHNIGKLETVVMQTADSLLDTKRRLEYGIHQIVTEISKQAKGNSKEVMQTFVDRFDIFEATILDEESGALNNLTSRIQEEIGRVWRQIGIMHQQMTATTDTLNKLENQTDSYVTGSLNAMDTMKGKVGLITGHMSEVEENLNFLLGKLSLMSQEFKSMKSGLGVTLDDIRETFKNIDANVKREGPGPHRVDSREPVQE